MNFYARYIGDYGSKFEEISKKLIIEKFGGDIIPFPDLSELEKKYGNKIKYDIGLYTKEKEHFFPLIDKCDIFIMTGMDNIGNRDKGKLSEGVKIEALYALALGKKVYKLVWDDNGIYRFIEIKNISDIGVGEELIKMIYYMYKKYLTLTDETDKLILELMHTEKRMPHIIHPKIVGLYERNGVVLEMMKGLLSHGRTDGIVVLKDVYGNDIKKHGGFIRPITIHIRYPKVVFGKNKISDPPIRYKMPIATDGERIHFTLPDLTLDDMNSKVGEMHINKAFFDDRILDGRIRKETDAIIEKHKNDKGFKFKPYMVFNKYVRGFGVIFDIDVQTRKGPDGKRERADMFDDDVYKDLMIVKKIAEKYNKEKIGWKFVSGTTGNGFNIWCEPYWLDLQNDTYDNFRKTMEIAVLNINSLARKEGVTRAGIDAKILDWSIYKKMVWTYQAKRNKITLPVCKGDVDKDWLEKMSDIDNFLLNEKENLRDVIERCGWDKDKWW